MTPFVQSQHNLVGIYRIEEEERQTSYRSVTKQEQEQEQQEQRIYRNERTRSSSVQKKEKRRIDSHRTGVR